MLNPPSAAVKALLVLSLLALPTIAHAIHLSTFPVDVDLTTDKVIVVAGRFDEGQVDNVMLQLMAHRGLPGPLVVVVKSGGGSTASGAIIVQMLQEVQSRGTKVICVAVEDAHSMAFNLLSFCDSRYATEGTTSVVHPVATIPNDRTRWTVRNLRKLADDMVKYEEPWRSQNARKMHLPLALYDHYANDEKQWTATELLLIGFLNGIASLD